MQTMTIKNIGLHMNAIWTSCFIRLLLKHSTYHIIYIALFCSIIPLARKLSHDKLILKRFVIIIIIYLFNESVDIHNFYNANMKYIQIICRHLRKTHNRVCER